MSPGSQLELLMFCVCDAVEAAGGEGLQLFDSSVPLDSTLIRQLVNEVLAEMVTDVLGQSHAPDPGPGRDPRASGRRAQGEVRSCHREMLRSGHKSTLLPVLFQEKPVPLVPTPVPTPPPSPTPTGRQTTPLSTPPPSEPTSLLHEDPSQPITGQNASH